MKKFSLVLMLVLLSIALISCGGKEEVPTETSDTNSVGKVEAHYPYQSVNEVRDAYGNILQQVLYNTQTGDTYIYDYKYNYDCGAFYCVGSWLTIIEAEETSVDVHTPTITVKPGVSTGNAPSKDNSVVQPQLLFDSGSIKAWLVEYKYEDFFDDHIFKLKIQNNSNQTVDIRTEKEVVNGNMQMDDEIYLWESVDGNKVTYVDLYIHQHDLDDFEIDALKSLSFNFIVCSTNSWDGILANEEIKITID